MTQFNFNTPDGIVVRPAQLSSGFASPLGPLHSVEEVATRLKLKRKGKDFVGANPTGNGATKDGFILYPKGNAYDRKLKQSFNSAEVAKMAGIRSAEYEPVDEWRKTQPDSYRNDGPPRRDNWVASPDRPAKAEKAKAPNTRFDWSKAHIFDYTDENGRTRFQVGRINNPDGTKQIRQRCPNPNGNGWVYRLDGVKRVLFSLPDVIKAEKIFVCEGEKAAEGLNADLKQSGLYGEYVATTTAQGAGNALKTDLSPLHGKTVTILPDNDGPGEQYRDDFLNALAGQSECRVVNLPDRGEGGDYVDFREAGHSLEDCLSLIEAAPIQAAKASSEPATGSHGARGTKPSQLSQLIEIGKQAELFYNSQGKAHATFRQDSHYETSSLRGKGYRQWLRHQYYQKYGVGPGRQAFQDSLEALECLATLQGTEKPVSVRVAEQDGNIYLDLANDDWQVIEITGQEWRILNQSPVKFIRPAGMQALPIPSRGGSINQLRPFVNVAEEEDFWLIIGWLLAALRPGRPYLILGLGGEQGSAKSTLTKLLRFLVDPNVAPLRRAITDQRDLAVGAANTHVLALDNLSSVLSWLSDALCCLATGGAYATRTLYSDEEESIFQALKAIILNGIGELITAGDLLDRAIILRLPVLPDTYRSEAIFWKEFFEVQASILGALLDAMVVGLKRLPEVHIERPPRMVDAALWVTACEPGLGWEPGTFLEAYRANREEASHIATEASAIGSLLRDIAAREKEWIGNCETLLRKLDIRADDYHRKHREWPTSSKGLSVQLERLAPNLRAQGVLVERLKRTGSSRLWRIQQVAPGEGASEGAHDGSSDGTSDGGSLPRKESTYKRDGGDGNDGPMGGSTLLGLEKKGGNSASNRLWDSPDDVPQAPSAPSLPSQKSKAARKAQANADSEPYKLQGQGQNPNAARSDNSNHPLGDGVIGEARGRSERAPDSIFPAQQIPPSFSSQTLSPAALSDPAQYRAVTALGRGGDE